MIKKIGFFLFSVCCAGLLFGCSGVNFTDWRFPYMYPVQQGNYVTEQQISLLKVGMTKDQVSSVMGSPVGQFMFNANQWQYNYQQYKNNKLTNSYIVNINFDNKGILNSIESSGDLFLK